MKFRSQRGWKNAEVRRYIRSRRMDLAVEKIVGTFVLTKQEKIRRRRAKILAAIKAK